MQIATGVPTQTTASSSLAHRRVRTRFYLGMSAALLLVVFIGFSRTLFLRAFFDVPELPASVWMHGLVLTGWFLGFFVQTVFVARRRTDIHRQLGWALAALGVVMILSSLLVTLNYVPRQRALGADIDAGIAIHAWIVWADLSATLAFTALFGSAVFLRRQPDVHKRLMVLASISMVQPAMTRIAVMVGVPLHQSSTWATTALLILLLAVVAHDRRSTPQLRRLSAAGAAFVFGTKAASIFLIATAEFGQRFVRGL